MTERVYNVLFLCTGNSARSLLGEAIVNQLGVHRLGEGRFKGFSAGSQPKGTPHPYTIDLLAGLDLPVMGLRSKSWDEFAAPGAPQMYFICCLSAGLCGAGKSHKALRQPAARQPRPDVAAGKARRHRPQAAVRCRSLKRRPCRSSNAI